MGSTTGPGVLGRAANFGIGNNHLYIEVYGKSGPGIDPFTLAAWFKTTDPRDHLPIIHGASDYGDDVVALEIIDGSPSALVHEHSSTIKDNRLTHPLGLADGLWHHLAMTFTGGGDDTLRLFVDGRLSGIHTQTAGSVGISDWHVAKEYEGSNYFGGALDDVRMYDRALSDGGVSQIGQLAGGDIGHLRTLSIPEPGTLVLLICGLLGALLVAIVRRQRR